MIYDILFIIILVVHWFADFMLQTDEMSKKKSSNFKILLKHTAIYSFIWFIVTWFIFYDIECAIFFTFITFTTHTLIDYNSSKLTSYLYKKGNYYWFFKVIGIDQVLHYLQLWFTFKLIILCV